jgi:predicted tellurium resistance membrane protein TerC
VVRVELVNLAFSIDSILVAVAVSPTLWVVLAGGILGIIAMRLVVGQLLRLIQRYPALVDGAFVIIAWVAVKLILEFMHAVGYIGFEVPQWLSLGLIVVIFTAALIYAKTQGARQAHFRDDAADLLSTEEDEEPPARRAPRAKG